MVNEVILLTAHLDHLGGNGTGADQIFNGADDDASGSAAVLELAEALAKGQAAEADADLRLVRQRGGRRLRRALLRRAPAGAARSI